MHLSAMRDAFARLGCKVTNFDEPDSDALDAGLNRLERQHPLDFVYERYSLGNTTASRFARRQRIPLVLEVNSPLADEQLRYRGKQETKTEQENDRYLFSNAHTIVAVSSAVADYAIGRGAHSECVMVCPNGIDEQRFNLGVREKPKALASIPTNSMVLGFHGRERPWHGFDKLVESFRKLLSLGLPVHLLVIGEGEFAALRQLPQSGFTRLGWQAHDTMPGLVANYDILPLTHQPDAPYYFSPLKLTEAMACGVVPVVPDMGDLASTVRHGETGYVYPAGDMDRLVQVIENLCHDPTERDAIGLRAAKFAATMSWTGIAQQIMQGLPVVAISRAPKSGNP